MKKRLAPAGQVFLEEIGCRMMCLKNQVAVYFQEPSMDFVSIPQMHLYYQLLQFLFVQMKPVPIPFQFLMYQEVHLRLYVGYYGMKYATFFFIVFVIFFSLP